MPQHEDEVRLAHVLDHSCEAVELCRGRERADLDRNRMLNLALVRLIEIIGEAANRVSPDRQTAMQVIPWPEIIGMRNRIVHGYDHINFDILWTVIQGDLPPLIQHLKTALGRD